MLLEMFQYLVKLYLCFEIMLHVQSAATTAVIILIDLFWIKWERLWEKTEQPIMGSVLYFFHYFLQCFVIALQDMFMYYFLALYTLYIKVLSQVSLL